ncbi:Mce protein [Mycolicibacter sp. MYC123]|uniref:Mce protein n=1 Tax=[Mycobacterium] zoologicum TaxID=2872311 RepID=A0ABU5YQ69_9MYCO|nr:MULTISPECIES: Mce protein [unclassified Mycolicibacter]MEB3051119.1 Mce protein [Mycolicibacter sp. MYC123]MEB3064248.1 Mce protein [Mycolicibacter sp. MYC101]
MEETVDATAAEPEAAAVPPQRRRIPRRTVAVAAAYLAVFGLVAGLGWPLWQQHRLTSAAAAGQRAAVDYAEALTSIDSNRVDDDFATVLNGATGNFKETYTKASVQLRQLLIDNKASAQGKVVQSAVQSESIDTVVVLLMVDQTVTNTTRPDPRVDRSRMKMTMQKVDGRWLASKVELP